MRIIAVDPGKVNIGLAISDNTGTIANPLVIIKHTSREEDAQKIVAIANQYQVKAIVVGQSIDDEGKPNLEGRGSLRLAAVLRKIISVPIILRDEYNTTKQAVDAQMKMKVKKKSRKKHADHIAATILLQSYLDEIREENENKQI